jgi:hypothetical protein
MFKTYLAIISIAILSVFSFTAQPVLAEWGVSLDVGSNSDPYDTYYGDRITTEYRRGYQTDDWVERGASSVTESPVFSDGIRLSAWATLDRDDYDYAIASAVYFFEVPPQARSLRIKVHYEGEGDVDDVNDEIAGRVWIKKTTQANDYEEYYPSEGRYESIDKPLYGDTFVLPAQKHLEIIRTSAQDHINSDGIMELHIVAEGRQRIDVKYIEVETYTYMPNVRVITRYNKDYTWRPWQDYTYLYFYTGPVFHFSDYYYVRYTYPYYQRNYIQVRRDYDDYLRVYYVSNPYHNYIRWNDVANIRKGATRSWNRDRLSRWTSDYDDARKVYNVSSSKNRSSVDVQRSRERVRSVLANTTKQSPSAIRSRSIETRASAVPEMKQRRDIEQRTSSDVRIRSSESRSVTPSRVESSDSTKDRRGEVRTPANVKRDSSSNTENKPIIRTTPQRSSSVEPSKSAPPSNTEVKKKREVRSESKREESQKPESVQSREAPKEQPKKDTEVKSDEDDDDKDKDKDKNKDNSGSSSDSSSRKKVRDR